MPIITAIICKYNSKIIRENTYNLHICYLENYDYREIIDPNMM